MKSVSSNFLISWIFRRTHIWSNTYSELSILYEQSSKTLALPQPLSKGCLDRLGEKHCIFIFLISPSLMIALIKVFYCCLLINTLEILHTWNTSIFIFYMMIAEEPVWVSCIKTLQDFLKKNKNCLCMSNSITMKYKYHPRFFLFNRSFMPSRNIYIYFVNLVINITRKQQEHFRLLTSFCQDWRNFIPLAFLQIPDAQVWMPATAATTSMSQSLSTFNFWMPKIRRCL